MELFKKRNRPVLSWITLGVVPLFLYFLILINRSPNLLRPVGIALRFSFNWVILIVLLFFWGSFAINGWLGRWISLSVVLSVFALSLAGMWASGQSDALIMTGLLPISDAHGYYLDANLLLNNQPFSVFSSRRPLFAGLLAVILKVTGLNLQLTVALLVLMTALCCYLAARAVRRTSGSLAAAVFLLIIFLFYRRFAGTTMTENLGLSLGSLGFALLWRGPLDKSVWKAILGIAVLTLGLIARAGPFFILVGIIIWAARIFRKKHLFSRWVAGAGILVVILGFGLNYLMFTFLGNPQGVLFTNFTYSFYGLVTGGQRWDAVYQEHPEIFKLPEKDQPLVIYRLAFEKIRQNPMGPVQGVIKQYGYLVSPSWYNAYGYVSNTQDYIDITAQYVLILLAAAALWLGWAQRKSPHMALVYLMFLGVLLSVPFVPPGDTNRMRAYATVIPVFAILPALGASMILKKIGMNRWIPIPTDSQVLDLTAPLAIIIVIGISILPLIVRWISSSNPVTPVTCQPGEETAYVQYAPGSEIVVHNEKEFFLDWLPDFHQGRYTSYIHSMPYMDLMGELLKVQAPFTIFTTNDLKTNQSIWVISDTNLLPSRHGILGLCGRYRPAETVDTQGFFDVTRAQLLKETPFEFPWIN
jgi:hypothetical protein